ncbi:hypothetical protein ACS0TY_005760 [Phlomoides rotata]
MYLQRDMFWQELRAASVAVVSLFSCFMYVLKAKVLRISVTVITCSLFLLSSWIISANPLLASDTQLLIIFPQDLLEDLSRLEEGLKENVKQLSSFDKYKLEVLLEHLDWSPMHKDPIFWRENITCFEENDFQVNYPFSLLIMWL